MWPTDARDLVAVQRRLAAATPPAWSPGEHEPMLGGCWVCFPRGVSGPGRAGDPLWSAAAVTRGGEVVAESVVTGEAAAPYEPGLLALRIGAALEEAVRALPMAPEVVLVDAGARDHPRRAGLAIHLGVALDTPTVGVTHRPLLARGEWPGPRRGDTSAVRIGDEIVGCWMRTQAGTRPLAVHPGWRTGLSTAVALVEASTRRQRTPEPLRRARELARRARATQ